MKDAVDFQVRRDDLRVHRQQALPQPDAVELAAGEVLLGVDVFALTANNVTYAVAGDMMNYWDFFPAEDGWGRVPVWGFGDVLRSRAEGVEEGERFYGYFPMASQLVVSPTRVGPQGFTDGAAHRQHLNRVYNTYNRVSADPGYDPAREAEQMLLRPLFMTSFLLDDYLADNDFFGAGQVLLTSASSKTAIGLAHLLHRNRAGQVRVIGLTSPGNRAFCEALGCYHQVLAYADLEDLGTDPKAVVVDMAGDAPLRMRIHRHFGDALRHDCMVGVTHWEAGETEAELPGPAPQMFFAPAQIQKRAGDWGPGGLEQRAGVAWAGFLDATGEMFEVRHERGTEAVAKRWLEALDNRLPPSCGQLLSL